MWNLHYAEWRILAEGMRVKRERQDHEIEKQRAESEHGRSRPTGEPTEQTKQMTSEYAEEIRAAKQGTHPSQASPS